MDKLKMEAEDGDRLYEIFVKVLHEQFGGPAKQRTPTTDSAQRIAGFMQADDGENLCYELCREYLSNTQE